jgi:hypothetical protein
VSLFGLESTVIIVVSKTPSFTENGKNMGKSKQLASNRGPVSPEECRPVQSSKPLSAEAQQIVDYINRQLKRSGRGGASVVGSRAYTRIQEAARSFRNAGWQVRTSEFEGIKGRTIPGYAIRPYSSIDVWR